MHFCIHPATPPRALPSTSFTPTMALFTNFSPALAALLVLVPASLFGYGSGPDPGYAGVPGEASCTSCHGSGTGTGSVSLTFPGGSTYTPGVTQHLIVTVADSTQRRWGFQLSARLSSSSSSQAGSFTPGSDGYTQLTCTSSTFQFIQFGSPCAGSARYPLEYIEQTSAGSRPGLTGSAQFAFDWTPPANASGNIVIYVAANAANNNGSDSGDHIYTRTYTLTPAASNVPSISANGILNAAGFQNTIAAGSWVAIEGSNLSSTTRLWTDADFVNGALPTQLDGVKVTINGKPAFVEYVSPELVNVQAPSDTATGLVPVQVTNSNGTSQTVMANLQTVAPAIFLWNQKYAATTRPDYSLVGPPNLFSGVTTTPAKPGDVIVFWGTGFGITTPAVAAGQNTPADQLYNTSNPVTVLIGSLQAEVLAAVLTPGNAGLYQIAVRVPANAPAGDLPVIGQINGVQTPSGVLLTVAQ